MRFCSVALRLGCLATAVLLLFACAGTPRHFGGEQPLISTFISYPIEKIRPDDTPRHSLRGETKPTTIRLARNEREPVLVGVANTSDQAVSVSAVTVAVNGGRYELEVFQVEYFTVTDATGPIGGRWKIGRWPDPLVPLSSTAASSEADGSVHAELPTAVEVPPGENRLFLVDVYLPPARLPEETADASRRGRRDGNRLERARRDRGRLPRLSHV